MMYLAKLAQNYETPAQVLTAIDNNLEHRTRDQHEGIEIGGRQLRLVEGMHVLSEKTTEEKKREVPEEVTLTAEQLDPVPFDLDDSVESGDPLRRRMAPRGK